MQRKIELLAPGGDIDSIKAAILARADAVYCGLSKFNARNRAANISFEELLGILRLAHKHNCKVFITINIIILDSEIPELIKLLNRLVNTRIDGVIVQDLGLFYILSTFFKNFEVHASTQVTTHNAGQIKFLSKLNINRVNLSRELNINEIKNLTSVALRHEILTEVFVHGSFCLSFSGICYMSSLNSANSGNRGKCSQPCRDRYERTPAGNDFPLNLKDNSAFSDLRELYNAGVDSLKIEGRIKESEYVYTIVNAWREQLDRFYRTKTISDDNRTLHKVFNRDFTNGFLKGEINADMFIDNPLSNVMTHHADKISSTSDDEINREQENLYSEKEQTRAHIKRQISKFDISKIPLEISITGKSNEPLVISIKSPDNTFEVHSEVNLANDGAEALTHKILLRRLKAIEETEYFIQTMEFIPTDNLYLPFKELTALKKRILYILNDSKKIVPPVKLPKLERTPNQNRIPKLSVLISSPKDVNLGLGNQVDLYFQLPSDFKNQRTRLIELFKENTSLIPWFPSILIGDDYIEAVNFLEELKPSEIVTNNTGVAYEAYNKGISWIAGPMLNISNSYSLLSLKENFNCKGAFLTHEISRRQIQQIRKPSDFNLYYTIYQPALLMTTRQCLFHQVTGCHKSAIDEYCIPNCQKTAHITNVKGEQFLIEKSQGNYHRIFSDINILNTDIAIDTPNDFSSFLIDLTQINTGTNLNLDLAALIELFNAHLNGDEEATQELKKQVYPTQNKQYEKGL